MSLSFEKRLNMIIAYLIMGGALYLIAYPDMATILDAMSASFFLVINGYLGVNIAAVMKQTNDLPDGQYVAMKKDKYYMAVFMMASLFAFGFYRMHYDHIPIVISVTAFGTGTITAIGLLVAGMEGNKMLTGGAVDPVAGKDKDTKAPDSSPPANQPPPDTQS